MRKLILQCMNTLLRGGGENEQESKDIPEDSNDNKTSIPEDIFCPCRCNATLPLQIVQRLSAFKQAARKDDLLKSIESQGKSIRWLVCDCCSKQDLLPEMCRCIRNPDAWVVVKYCLQLLLLLKDNLDEELLRETENDHEESNRNHLGVYDQQTVKGIIQLIVALGIYKHLVPGVGIPIELRMKNTSNSFLTSTQKQCHAMKLLVCVKCVLYLTKNRELNSLVLAHMSTDLIAALIQLSFRPKQSVTVENCTCGIDVAENTLKGCLCCDVLCEQQKQDMKNELNKLLDRLYQPLVVRELLALQGTSQVLKECMGTKQPPKWFQRKCGQLLSKCMMKKEGVKSVVQGIFQGCDLDKLSWHRCQMIGKLIAYTPFQASSVEQYYEIVTPQILTLLDQSHSASEKQWQMVLSATVRSMMAQQKDLAQRFVVTPLLSTLHILVKDESDVVSISESELATCLQNIHIVFTIGDFPSKALLDRLLEVIDPLFKLYCFVHRSPSHIKASISRLLCYILNNVTTEEGIEILNLFAFGESSKRSDVFKRFSPHWKFVFSDAGGVKAEKNVALDEERFAEVASTEDMVVSILQLVGSEEAKQLRGFFFINLLEKLNRKVAPKNSSGSKGVSQPLREVDSTISHLMYMISLTSLLAAFLDRFGDTILQNTRQIINFINSILKRYSSQMTPKKSIDELLSMNSLRIDSHEEDDFYQQTLNLALMLLSTLVANEQLTSDDFDALQDLLPSLELISERDTSGNKCMANDIRICIATRGAVQSSSTDDNTTPMQQPETEDYTSVAAYEDALKDLRDPLLPSRGHGLLQLVKLLRARNPSAIANKDKLLHVLEANLVDDDTYIYLASIKAIVALADVHGEAVIQLLCKKFLLGSTSPSGSQDHKLSPELRMKLIEALVKVCHSLGNMLPKYLPLLFSSLFTGVKDEESYVRASSLSAIGDVCQVSKFALTPYMQEIISCVSCVMADDACEVRRAGMQVFTLLFKGVAANILQVVGDSMREVYKLIKGVAEYDADDITRTHAMRALGELDSIMREELFRKPTLEKKIQILG